MKNFLKKLKEHFLLRTAKSEMILLIIVIALIAFKFASENSVTKKAPVGDFGPSPYENYINSQGRD